MNAVKISVNVNAADEVSIYVLALGEAEKVQALKGVEASVDEKG